MEKSENWVPEARCTPAHFFEDDIYSSMRQEYTRKRCTVALKKHFHARQRSHARDRSPSTPRVKEKTNLLISKTPPKLTGKLALKQAKNRDPSLPNLSQRYGARPISVRLLDTTSRWRRFARGLRRELFSRGFPAGGFTSSLFGTSHLYSLLDFLCRRHERFLFGKGMERKG